jgi:hypothetical protein
MQDLRTGQMQDISKFLPTLAENASPRERREALDAACQKAQPDVMTTPATRLQVTPIAGEPDRFLVASQSRPGLDHVVDMNWQEHPRQKPHPSCGCEAVMCHGHKTCPHIRAVRAFLSQPDYHEKDFKTMI